MSRFLPLVALFLSLQSATWANSSAPSASPNRFPKSFTMACPEQLRLGMSIDAFTVAVKQQTNETPVPQGSDDKKLIADVPSLHVCLAGYGDFINPDFVFYKSGKSYVLAAIQEDVSDLPTEVMQSKIATMCLVLGAPKISHATDGSNVTSSTWISNTDRHIIFSFYKNSDGHMLFLVGNREISPELDNL